MLHKNFLRFTLAALLLAVSAVSAWADVTYNARLYNTDATLPYQIASNFGGAWGTTDQTGYSGKGVKIGIIDDAVQTSHPYLSTYGDGSSRFDTTNSKFYMYYENIPYAYLVDFTTTGGGSNPPTASDVSAFNNQYGTSYSLSYDYGHGTCVAGCAAAYSTTEITVNGYTGKINGAAYNASIVAVGTALPNSGSMPTLASTQAFKYLATQNCDVINNSYGISQGFVTGFGYGSSLVDAYEAYNLVSAIHDVVKNNNAIVLFSAGNERLGSYYEESGTIYYYNNTRDCNKKSSQASPDTITVAALGPDANSADLTSTDYSHYAYFSCYGANVFTCAPGWNVPSSDRTGTDGYSSGDSYYYFNGTSAASPVASGIVAVAVEAINNNPNGLTSSSRLMKHMIVESLKGDTPNIDASNTTKEAGWTKNAAGIWFSPSYGFGKLDAGALVSVAETTYGVTEQTVFPATWDLTNNTASKGTEKCLYLRGSSLFSSSETTDAISLVTDAVQYATSTNYANTNTEISITDVTLSPNDVTGTTTSYIYTANFDKSLFDVDIQALEEVTLTVGMVAEYFGDIEINLTSPSGTASTLCFTDTEHDAKAGTSNDNMIWTFSSNAFWGENPEGKWTVEVKDTNNTNDTVQVKSIDTTFYMGEVKATPTPSETPVPEPGTWVLLVLGSVGVFWLKRRGTR